MAVCWQHRGITTSLHLFFHFCYSHKAVSSNLKTKLRYTFYSKKRYRDGVACVVLCVACTLPSIYLVCVAFGTAIPTSLYIFGKCFSYLFVCFFVVPQYHTCAGGCCFLQVKPTPLVGMYDSIILFMEAQNFNFSYLGSIFG